MILTNDIHSTKNTNLTERRFGYFYFTSTILSNAPDVISKIYNKALPLQVSYDPFTELYQVLAISDCFDPVETHAPIPVYIAYIKVSNTPKSKNKRSITVSFIKEDEYE